MSRQLAKIAIVSTHMIAAVVVAILALQDAGKEAVVSVIIAAVVLDYFVFGHFLRCPKCKKHQHYRTRLTCQYCPECGADLNDE